MSKIFLIPGLGADYRIYKNIDLSGHDVVNVSWIEPEKQDTLASYAHKLIDKYSITPDSIVIGNSLGGMLAIEMAKRIGLKKTILISSIKTIKEAPLRYKLYRYIPVNRTILPKMIRWAKSIIKFLFGRKVSGENQDLFVSMLENTSPSFIRWAKYAILNWDNQTIPKNVYHITGDEDSIFPYKRIKGATIVKGGSHVMILDKANEINSWLKEIL